MINLKIFSILIIINEIYLLILKLFRDRFIINVLINEYTHIEY